MMAASMQRFRSAILCACFLGAAYPAYGQNRDSEAADTIAVRQKETVPLQVQTPYPTLIHLAVEWLIEGEKKQINAGEVIFIERNKKHKITAIGNKMAIRLAVSRYDVDHVYTEGNYENE